MTDGEKITRMEAVLISIVRSSYVGRAGKPVMRSKHCNYPARLYHEAREIVSAIAAEVPVDEEFA